MSNTMEPITPAIPQTNPAVLVADLRAEVDFAIARVLGSGRYILGEEVELFEDEWARWSAPSTRLAARTALMLWN